tara:strand:- start:375 stop:554 length:180 start_codon:yes stop_codon:yes gene_type:complete
MNLITYQIAIESLQCQIERCEESKKEMKGLVEHSCEYWDTRIKDLKTAQDELAMETLTL